MASAGASSDREFTTDDFDFDLPRELIATEPARPRDSARLLEIGERLVDRTVRDLPRLLRAGDVMVVNDTRVIPARLRGTRRGAKVEVTLHKAEADGTWRAFARPARKLAAGDVIDFAEGFAARVVNKGEDGEVTLAFDDAAGLFAALDRHGEMPLPPYIARPGGATSADEADYQTVYAERKGAVAAPTEWLVVDDARVRVHAAADVHQQQHVSSG